MPISEISTALTALKAAAEIGTSVIRADKAMAVGLQLQVSDLMGALAEARVSMISIMEEVEKREKEIARLREALTNKAKVVLRASAYYESDESGAPCGDPYCMGCWQTDHLLIHLAPGGPGADSQCPRCKFKVSKHLARSLSKESP